MPKAMDFKKLDQIKEAEGVEFKRQRWKSRPDNPPVQMSIRMPEDTYLEFRALCKMERRTNGDMLEHLMREYLSRGTDATQVSEKPRDR